MIRKAIKKDIEKIVEFNLNLAKETEDKDLNKEILYKGVEAIIKDQSKGIYHIYEIDEKIIGQIMYTYEWSDRRCGTFIWVQSIYVDKEFRGKGIFRSLYNYVKEICDKDEEICGIRLYVERENYIAQKTYSDLGMIECNYNMYEYEK